MPKFRTKPIIKEAIQWTGQNIEDLRTFIKGTPHEWRSGGWVKVYTLEGEMTCMPGNWLIKGVKGEVYPCMDEIFKASYEPVIDEIESISDDLSAFA